MIGIAVGVTALITVLSVMNGFERELRVRILGMASHATISAYRGGLEDWPSVARLAAQNKAIEGLAPYRSEEHTSELQSLMRISYAGFCLKKKNNKTTQLKYY